ncbi:MAG TPA: hypothetical protein VIK54_07480 [Acidimicrobiia bacterium]
MDLFSDGFRDSPDMAVYARAVAAELEARFHRGRTTLYFSDLQVTASPPTCFESRQGCGTAVHWRFELQTRRALDAQVAGVATGRGELTIRMVDGVAASKCPHQPLVYGGASVSEPFVPEAFSGERCLGLGPVVRRLVGATAQEDTVLSPAVPSTVRVALASADEVSLSAWASTHTGAELALILDGWTIGRIPVQTIVEARRADLTAHEFGVNKPMELTSVGVHQPMDGAIALAINTAAQSSPLFDDPVTSP